MNLTEADAALKAHPTRVKAVYATGSGTRARGVLIGYSDAPSGILRLPDGTNEHWRLDLIHLDDEPEPVTFDPHEPTADDWRDAANALAQENATLTDRLEALTQELALCRATLADRSEAVNRTGESNDRLRAQLAAIGDSYKRHHAKLPLAFIADVQRNLIALPTEEPARD